MSFGVSGYQPLVFNGTASGLTAITYDMVGDSTIIQPQCQPRH